MLIYLIKKPITVPRLTTGIIEYDYGVMMSASPSLAASSMSAAGTPLRSLSTGGSGCRQIRLQQSYCNASNSTMPKYIFYHRGLAS